jgi:hypothetical protein
MLEAGHPNLTLLEAASSCLPIVGTYKGTKSIPGMYVLEEISTLAVIKGISYTMNHYDFLVETMREKRESYDWKHVCKILDRFYENVGKIKEDYTSEKTKQLYVNTYNNTPKYV